MSFSIETIGPFDNQVKRLSKKYPSFKSDLSVLIKSLGANPTQGKALGNGFYKVRISISSKGKGKSGGARVITVVKIVKETVYLAYVYDKSEMASISDEEIRQIGNLIP